MIIYLHMNSCVTLLHPNLVMPLRNLKGQFSDTSHVFGFLNCILTLDKVKLNSLYLTVYHVIMMYSLLN